MRLPRDPQDAVLLENDIVGVRLWGPPNQPTLSIGRSDVWDRRWFADRQPLVTMEQIRAAAASGDFSALAPMPNTTVYKLYQQYEFPCPKPGAQLILGLPFATESFVQRLDGGRLRLLSTGAGKRLEADVWIMLDRCLVVIACRPDGLEAGDVWLRIYRHQDTIRPGAPNNASLGGAPTNSDFEVLSPPQPVLGADCWGVRQAFPADLTFPQGFQAVVATAMHGVACELCAAENETGLGTPLWAPQEGQVQFGVIKNYTLINQALGAAVTATVALPAGRPFAVLTAIATTQDDADAWAAAERLAREACAAGPAQLLTEHERRWAEQQRPLPAQVRVSPICPVTLPYGACSMELREKEASIILAARQVTFPSLRRRGGYYGDVPLCSVGSTKFWFQDSGLWHNDFHFNELRAEPMLALGLFPELLPYCEMIASLLPVCEENARDVYSLPGAMFPLVHFPLRCQGVAHVNLTWEQDLGLNGLVTKPLWLYYRYTGDREFLADLAYPALRSCARFNRAYLTEENDGFLHLVPTVSPEHWGLTPKFERNRDATSALTLTRYLLRAAAAAARVLDADAREAADWNAAAERLAPFPLWAGPDGPVWVDVADAPPIEYNVPVPLSPVFWGDEVGLDSPAETLDMARRTLKQIRIWEPHRPYLDWCIRPRLGVCEPDAPLVPESFLLSYQTIRLFPSVPPEVEIMMQNFAAEGGFRVSAARPAGGKIEKLRILSTLGGRCSLANPWPGQSAVVRDDRGRTCPTIGAANGHVIFETEKDGEYALESAGYC